MLDVRRLEIYCTVAEEGSFTAAAARLYLTQSAVSQQIATLERDIGVALVERIPRGIRLTEAGKLLADRARSLLRDMASLEQELRRTANPPKQIHLGVFVTAGSNLIPMLMRQYRLRHPDSQLVLHALHPEDLARDLSSRVIDVGLIWEYDYLPRQMDSLATHHLFDEPMRLLLPQEHPGSKANQPVQLADFANDQWVVRGHKYPYEEAFESMCRIAGFEPKVAFRIDDYQSMQGLVAAGIGLALAPHLSIIAQRSDIAVLPIERPLFMRRIQAVTLPDASNNLLVSQLLDFMRELWTGS